jgi:hypothetical protein
MEPVVDPFLARELEAGRDLQISVGKSLSPKTQQLSSCIPSGAFEILSESLSPT